MFCDCTLRLALAFLEITSIMSRCFSICLHLYVFVYHYLSITVCAAVYCVCTLCFSVPSRARWQLRANSKGGRPLGMCVIEQVVYNAVSKMVWWDSQSFWFARLEIILTHTACLCVCVCVCVWFPIIRMCPVYLFVCFCVCTREMSPNKASSRTLHCGPKSLWHVQSLFGSSPLDCLKSTFLIFFNLAPLGQFRPAS